MLAMAKVLSNFPKAHAGEDSGEYYNSGSSPSGHSLKRTARARTRARTRAYSRLHKTPFSHLTTYKLCIFKFP